MPLYRHKGSLIYFAHVPKCGGTSIEDYLSRRFGPAAFLDRRFLRRRAPWTRTSPQHVTAADFSRLVPPSFVDVNFAVVRHPAEKISLMPQAFDPLRMQPPPDEKRREGILFVGIARRFERPMVQHALKAGVDIELWGSGWDDGQTARLHKGKRIANETLGQHYAGAEIVLNDHTPLMRRIGLPSNRIFDALACAASVISDPVAWMPDDLRDFVEIVEGPEGSAAAVARIRAEGPGRRAARVALVRQMRDTHSFDARARQIVETARRLEGRRSRSPAA